MNAAERRILARVRAGSKSSREQRLAQYEDRALCQLPADLFNTFEVVRVLVRRQDRLMLGNILTGVIAGLVILLVQYLAGVK